MQIAREIQFFYTSSIPSFDKTYLLGSFSKDNKRGQKILQVNLIN